MHKTTRFLQKFAENILSVTEIKKKKHPSWMCNLSKAALRFLVEDIMKHFKSGNSHQVFYKVLQSVLI